MNDDPHGTGWHEITMHTSNWPRLEHTLGPTLTTAHDTTSWWLVRKGPELRLRYKTADDAGIVASNLIEKLAASGVIDSANSAIYEPETHRFGGTAAMEIAHRLFSDDTLHLLQHLAEERTSQQDLRRELSLRLAAHLLNAAGLDWYEQGDVYQQVVAHRTLQPATPTARTIGAVHRLLTAAADSPASPLTAVPAWPAAFVRAGQELAYLDARGLLARGLRAVLADHLLFLFNRHGIRGSDQAILATAASHVIFHTETPPARGSETRVRQTGAATLSVVTTDTQTTDAVTHQQGLADYIRDRGTFTGHPEVETAFRTVFRHQFLPGVPLDIAYGNKPVVTKTADDGTALSSASNANLVAGMLGQLHVNPGDKVLEIGAATGYNAALLAELAGPHGQVVTIEYDADLAAGATQHLADAGYRQVTVVCGDGAHGHPGRAPYDRIIVTAGAADISTAWWEQLAIGGRLVVPLRLHASGLSRSIAFTLTEAGRLVSDENPLVCGFVPMRGAAEAAERHVRLAEDVLLKIDAADQPDETGLAGALAHPAEVRWTGIRVHDTDPAEHLDLWLATAGGICFGRVSVGQVARSSGLADPALRWAGATVYDGATIAYLAVRPTADDENELGLVAHGPGAADLAARSAELLHRWNTDRPAVPVITAVPARSAESASLASTPRPDTRIILTWQR